VGQGLVGHTVLASLLFGLAGLLRGAGRPARGVRPWTGCPVPADSRPGACRRAGGSDVV